MPNQRLSIAFATGGLLFVVAVSALAQTPDPKTKSTGAISGKVTVNDAGAADILITAQPLDRPAQRPAARTTTDVSGRYRLTELPAGHYQVAVLAPAMTAVEQSGPGGSLTGAVRTVILSEGEELDDVDIRLMRGSVITGKVTDADGKPVISERVNIQAIDRNGNPSVQPNITYWNYQMSQTDDRGIYRIYGLPPGFYRVSVGASEDRVGMGRRVYYSLTFHGDTSDPAKATVVELQQGTEATNIDIRVGRAANTFVASGRLVDAGNGQPLGGAYVTYGVARPDRPFQGEFGGVPTNARGEFRIEGLEPGRYGVSPASFDATHYAEALMFEIIDADVTNLEVKATRGLTLAGIVVLEDGGAKDSTPGQLRVWASVTPSANAEGQTSVTSASAVVRDGRFQLTGLRPGKVQLGLGILLAPALRRVTVRRVERGGVDVMQNLELQAGESITDLRIVAAMGSGTIRGTVRVVGGELPANAQLYVNTKLEGANSYAGGPVDARGRFAVTNLTSGTYEVTVIVHSQGPSTIRPTPPQKQMVTLSDNGESQIDFIIDLAAKGGRP